MNSKLLQEKKLIRMMREEYKKRLLEIVVETDLFDKRGNLIIKPGLKVTHKKSGFEYTVADVTRSGDDVTIALRMPDEPRFTPPEEVAIKDASRTPEDLLGEVDSELLPLRDTAKEESSAESLEDEITDVNDDDIFVIDKKEFEKDYEVK